ncbi:triose-phosphate isomerase family protein [Blautia sp. JLR.GB0024]|uniref:triose-phosphate isomerase family protein n=1 Tax=Blautia sp. JLR.GB0024 TaxID=3123295 RepID=UPI0030042DA0
MKYIYLNLKRFDVPEALGGVNRIVKIEEWGSFIIKNTQEQLKKYAEEAEFAMFFPELHLFRALEARSERSPIEIGCQGVFWQDVQLGGNFGAFTTDRPAAAMKAAGCEAVLIGHCEERNHIGGILEMAGSGNSQIVNRILNEEVKAAVGRGLKVLYCIGEKSVEQERWKEILSGQLEVGLKGVDRSKIVIAYEPVWSIGPGKTPADKDYISKIARFVKEKTGGMNIVYGGGLKKDNAAMIASIPEIDGGLIALTRFQGEIGFYPEEYLEIISLYLGR